MRAMAGNGMQWNHEEEEARPSPAEMFTQVVGVDVVAQTSAVVDAVLGATVGTMLQHSVAQLAQRTCCNLAHHRCGSG